MYIYIGTGIIISVCIWLFVEIEIVEVIGGFSSSSKVASSNIVTNKNYIILIIIVSSSSSSSSSSLSFFVFLSIYITDILGIDYYFLLILNLLVAVFVSICVFMI